MLRVLTPVILASLLATTQLATPLPAAHADPVPPGAPGATAYFDLARKDCLGTARNTRSKVWYTVANGVLSDVYEPTIDNTNVDTLQYVVTDGRTFTDLQTRDTSYTVRADDTGMVCTVTSTSAKHRYRLTTTYITDPARDSVVMHTTVDGPPDLRVYARLDGHVNGNSGDNAAVVDGVPVLSDTDTVSQATNRDYAVPTFMALVGTSTKSSTVGYAGSASDGLTQLDATHGITRYTSAPNGHVTATQDVTGRDFTLALGFGRDQNQAVATARTSARSSFERLRGDYSEGWRDYDRSLVRGTLPLDANVLKASVDKTFPGAVVASLASPWGQAVKADKPAYFGSYREVFARDAYEAFTGFLAAGDKSTARDIATFLLTKQQLPTGELPRNSLVNGKIAPDTGGDQLDETAYPILMAQLTGLADNALWTRHIKPAADYLLSHGPSFGVERWEEQSGYSPSTIAAEIAGLVAAGVLADQHGDHADARIYRAAADDFQRDIKSWTVTTTGPYGPSYFVRLTKNGDPNSAVSYSLGNGGPTVDQRAVVDGGFQELVRLGELSPQDKDFTASLAVLDKQISVRTATGVGYYRYGTSASAGSADGYGDCYQPSQSSCAGQGQPWPTTDTGTGHLWPVLSGERAESALTLGDGKAAKSLLDSMFGSASGVGLVPEQAWENPDLAASPYGTDPTTASIGFANGHAAGSASPLTWAQAQRLRLAADLRAGRVLDRPSITTDRYVSQAAPGKVDVTVAATASGGTASVTGKTLPGADVSVQAVATDTAGKAGTVSTTAGSDGAYTVSVPVGFGSNSITVGVSASGNRTGYAHTTVTGDLVGGTSVLDAADPSGDDNGPGTYQYPTAADFVPGSFDLTRFQVVTLDDTVYLRTTLRNLVPTFGSTMGAQLLDIYVGTPGQPTSDAAPFPSRNYQVSPWSQRIELQGFAAPSWLDAAGHQVGTPSAAVASADTKTITVALPKAAFGTPGPGWTFSVVLTGQDGFNTDQARSFAATPQGYQFGVCAPNSADPICHIDPATAPKAMDTLPASQLDPTKGPVLVGAVTVS
ncbi:glucodextranase DOMON-like domain-containing protein [Kutzneria sp. CA-103260]|uniref:glucodextranase DOMON-like domain-containing protein n=1 Tax=Kutzneria sp. CA-103260 TaxID=2802641 RepID=UPI001BAA5F1E|nr:glucodextranase DOMON-like domain-containing protein [Kutzneria sp. CA-103260]QUQ62937.1 glucan 1,4-alpha-glucosidase [Kutzneria sp. CA-103260]